MHTYVHMYVRLKSMDRSTISQMHFFHSFIRFTSTSHDYISRATAFSVPSLQEERSQCIAFVIDLGGSKIINCFSNSKPLFVCTIALQASLTFDFVAKSFRLIRCLFCVFMKMNNNLMYVKIIFVLIQIC